MYDDGDGCGEDPDIALLRASGGGSFLYHVSAGLKMAFGWVVGTTWLKGPPRQVRVASLVTFAPSSSVALFEGTLAVPIQQPMVLKSEEKIHIRKRT